MGDTDRTPDGVLGGLLEYGGTNLKKAAPTPTRRCCRFAADDAERRQEAALVKDGVITVAARVSRGDLVRGQDLKLTIPVAGDLTSMFGLMVTGDPGQSRRRIGGREVVRQRRHACQGRREGWVTTCGCPTCGTARGASEVARLHAGEGRHDRQGAVPERARHRPGNCRRRRARRVGGHQGRAGGRSQHHWTDWKDASPGAVAQVAPRSGGLEEHAGRERARRTTARPPTLSRARRRSPQATSCRS